MSFVETLSAILSEKLNRENLHLSNIKEDDYKIAALYLLADILDSKELSDFADLLVNMKTAKRVRNDLLKVARAMQIRVHAGERYTVREVYRPESEEGELEEW